MIRILLSILILSLSPIALTIAFASDGEKLVYSHAELNESSKLGDVKSSFFKFFTKADSTNNDWDNDGIINEEDLCPETPRIYSEAENNGYSPDITFIEFCSNITGEVPALEFIIGVSDNINIDTNLALLFWLEGNQQTWLSIPYNQSEAYYYRRQELHENAANGIYAIRRIGVNDNQGNYISLGEGEINSLGFNSKTLLDHSNSDTLKPFVVDLQSSGWEFDEDDNPTIDFILKAADHESGLNVNDVIIEIISPTGSSIQSRSQFQSDSTATFKFVLSKYLSSGIYYINTIRLYDNAGNLNLSLDWLNDNPQIFELVNPNSDANHPELTSFNISARFDDLASRPILSVNGSAIDEHSGFANAYIRLNNPEGNHLDSWMYPINSDENGNTTFSTEFPLTTQFSSGEYGVGFLKLGDVAANVVYLNANDIFAVDSTFTTSVTIYQPSADDIETGNSVILASTSNDLIFGDNNSYDTIYGLEGNDTIHSSGKADLLSGGEGSDTFIFLKSSHSNINNIDTINDFDKELDVIQIPKFTDETLHTFSWMGNLESTLSAIIEISELIDNLVFFTNGIDGFLYHNRLKDDNILIKISNIIEPDNITVIGSSVSTVDLLYPENSAAGVILLPEFHWNEDESADNYLLQLSMDNFSSIEMETVVHDNTYNSLTVLESNSQYQWRVKSMNSFGSSDWSDIWHFTTGVSTNIESIGLPFKYTLEQNYPNPFNPTTRIQYSLASKAHVSIEIFNILGQKVSELVNEEQSAGYHSVTFNASNISGGVYLYKIKTQSFTETKKMLLVK